MNKTTIEWCDYTINPVKGLCPVACPYCYARRMYKRYKWDETIRLKINVFDECRKLEAREFDPQRIFVGSTMELFGEWVNEEWLENILTLTGEYPLHRFIFLTKRPENLINWSPFPDNCWVGASVTDQPSYERARRGLSRASATVKFISFEPLLGSVDIPGADFEMLNWVIIGQQTPAGPKTCPDYKWIEAIVSAADTANIPVFIKDNLNACAIGDHPNLIDYASGKLRQEFPV